MAELPEPERSPSVQQRGFRLQAPLVSPKSSLTSSCLQNLCLDEILMESAFFVQELLTLYVR